MPAEAPVAPRHSGWHRFWQADRPASCVPENPATAAKLAAHWVATLSSLPAHARVLDVATGNGIVLAHAVQAARAAGTVFELTGIDFAPIDPLRHLTGLAAELQRARFLGGVRAESLPFADGAFEAVTSQYGLEYADLSRALPEAARVLAPGGRLFWLAHDIDSDVVRQNAGQAEEVELLLAAEGPLAAMRRLVACIRAQRDTSGAMAQLQSALNAAERFCRERPPARVVVQVCTEVAAAANRSSAYRPVDLDTMLDRGTEELSAHRERIRDLAAAALDAAGKARIQALLQEPMWRDCDIRELRVGDGSPVGAWISGQRSG